MIYDKDTTVEQALAAWDRGESLFMCEMGGLGPGYEQCIQVLTVELLREYNGKPLPKKGEWEGWGDEVVARLNPKLGFSGAQVGAGKSQAARMLAIGYGAALEEMKALDGDRLIQVSRGWPLAEKVPA